MSPLKQVQRLQQAAALFANITKSLPSLVPVSPQNLAFQI